MILCSPLMCDPQNKCYVKDVVHKNPQDGRRKYEAVAGIDLPHVRIATCSRSPCVTCTTPIMPRCRYGHRLNHLGIICVSAAVGSLGCCNQSWRCLHQRQRHMRRRSPDDCHLIEHITLQLCVYMHVQPAGTQSVDGLNAHLKKGCMSVRHLVVCTTIHKYMCVYVHRSRAWLCTAHN